MALLNLSNLLLSLFVSGLGYLFYLGFLQQDTHFKRNRLFLLFCASLAVGLPFLPTIHTATPLPSQIFEGYVLPNLSSIPATESSKWQPWDILHRLYLIGVGAMGLHLLLKILTLSYYRWMLPRGEVMGHRVRFTDGKAPTGVWLNYIFWDNTLVFSPSEQWQIIQHEVCHIKRGHSWEILYLECLKVLHWYNPLLWAFQKSLVLQQEYEADHFVVCQPKTNAKTYQQLLINTTLCVSNSLFNPIFNTSQLTKRFMMMKKQQVSPMSQFNFLLRALPLVGLLSIFIWACKTESLDSKLPAKVANNKDAEKAVQKSTDQTQTIADSSKVSSNNQSQAAADANKQTSKDQDVVEIADVKPEYAEGIEAFYRKIGKSLHYPAEARRANLQGKVYIEFVVNTDGVAERFKVVKTFDEACGQAALETLQKIGGKWTPAQNAGQNVACKMVIPVVFKLN